MKGKLFKRKEDKVWMIRYPKPGFTEDPIPYSELPIYHKNLTESQKWHMSEGSEVEFEIMDEFTHPDLYTDVPLFEGVTLAMLKFK